MKKDKWYFGICAVLLTLLTACGNKSRTAIDDAEILHQNQDLLTQVIIYDVFTPPVASRIYVYSSLASYEAMKYNIIVYRMIKNIPAIMMPRFVGSRSHVAP